MAGTNNHGEVTRQAGRMLRWIRSIPVGLPAPAMLVAALLSGPAAVAGVFFPGSFTLQNGLRVVVIENRRAPIVEHMIWYRAGAADEPTGRSGVAHLLEHLMYKGTHSTEPGEFSRRVAQIGGKHNAFTGHDYTAYFQRVAVHELATVMSLEADRVSNIAFSDEDLEVERNVVLEERRSRVDDLPAAQLREHMRRALYLNSPYGRPVVGWEAEIRMLDRDDVMAFYRRHYVPGNAMLIVAGDVTKIEVERLARIHYGPIAAGVVPERVRPVEPPHHAPRRVDLTSDRVLESSWSRIYLVPEDREANGSRQRQALELFAELLGGGTTSHLYRKLVLELKVADSAGAWYSGGGLGYGEFGLYAVPAQGENMESLEVAIEEQLKAVLQPGLDVRDLERAKKLLAGQAVYARDLLGSGPRAFGRAFARGWTLKDVEEWPERIASVTIEDVQLAARQVLDLRRSVTGRLLPGTPDP